LNKHLTLLIFMVWNKTFQIVTPF